MDQLSKTPRAIRIFFHWTWILMLWVTGRLWWAKRKVRNAGVVVLTLHRVLRDEQSRKTASLPGMIVREGTFSALMAYLNENCMVLDLREPCPQTKASAKPRVAVTFDDGWSDTASVAFPALRAHGIPATVFICPNLVDKNMPFWPEQVVADAKRSRPASSEQRGLSNGWAEQLVEGLKQLPEHVRSKRLELLVSAAPAQDTGEDCVDSTMSWREVQQVKDGGMAIGSHTLSHQLLLTIPVPAAEMEIKQSRRLLEERLCSECSLFAYPNGDTSEELASIAREAGYKAAFVNEPGVWSESTDSMLVPRVNIWEGSLVTPWGTFSRLAVEYAIFWSASRAPKRKTFGQSLSSNAPSLVHHSS
jgi:peptidoglycan/xylan/chitin deacetylase (PgdA/CDA1 family)